MASEAIYLRAAAKRLRSLAAEATPGPWTLYDRGVGWELNELDWHDGTTFKRGDAHYIATVNPRLAEPIAKWLDDEAGTFDEYPASDNTPNRLALPVAYEILAATYPGESRDD